MSTIGWIRAIILLSAFTPITFVGGFGIREVSAVMLLSAFNVDVETATAFSLLAYTRSVIGSLFGGGIKLFDAVRHGVG